MILLSPIFHQSKDVNDLNERFCKSCAVLIDHNYAIYLTPRDKQLLRLETRIKIEKLSLNHQYTLLIKNVCQKGRKVGCLQIRMDTVCNFSEVLQWQVINHFENHNNGYQMVTITPPHSFSLAIYIYRNCLNDMNFVCVHHHKARWNSISTLGGIVYHKNACFVLL